MNAQLALILNTPRPAFVTNIRHLTRKEWAQNVRKLIQSLGLQGISVTTPNYSMAQSIVIRLPETLTDNDAVHKAVHDMLDRRNLPSLNCAHCNQRQQARKHLESIILTAFPDLDDRSELQSDSFDYCLSFE